MKKLITFFSAAVLVVLASSCGSTQAEPEKEAEAPVSDYVEMTMPEGEVILMDNFEDGNYWEAIRDSWGDNDKSVSCDISTDFGTDGETSLKCDFVEIGEPEKAGFLCNAPLETDWTGAKYIAIDVYNPNTFDLNLVAVTQAGENWESWNQTTGYRCPPGKHLIVFDISAFQNMNVVHRMIVYQFGLAPQGTLYFDNYRIIK